MDIQHVLSINPLDPAYMPAGQAEPAGGASENVSWTTIPGGTYEVGHDREDEFAFDNEGPVHEVLLRPFALANQPVSNANYLEFMRDGGYERPDLWLSDGWAKVREEGWTAPLYWRERDGEWHQFSLRGCAPVNPAAPARLTEPTSQ